MNLVCLPADSPGSFVVQDETIAFPGIHLIKHGNSQASEFFLLQHQRAEQYYTNAQLTAMRAFAMNQIALMKITRRLTT